jgi:type 2 lantibiotic biosynthesis protein LanM
VPPQNLGAVPHAPAGGATRDCPGELEDAVLSPGWWAAALTLAERCALPDPAGPAGSPTLPGSPVATDAHRVGRRRDHWRAALGHDQLAAHLGRSGLDEAGLVALMSEDRSVLARRAGKPEWAATMEAILERMPDEAPVAVPSDGFGAIVTPFVDLARRRLGVGSAARIDHEAVTECVVDGLKSRLIGLAGRTLVLELSVLRVTGQLDGATPERRFASFVRHFTYRRGLAILVDEYPVLARLLVQACSQAVDAHAELMRRFEVDRPAIVESLLNGRDPGDLVAVRAGSGDCHQRGRSVAILSFADGSRVVYKPRPMAVYGHFDELLGWLAARVTDLRRLRSLDRGRYGWCEFVEHLPCSSIEEVRSYYHRLGVLLALLYALDGVDVHFENVIACADQPVVVDLEALFHPPLPGSGLAQDDPAHRLLADSVARVGLLPMIVRGAGGALDISGIGGDPGQRSPFPSAGWAAAGTDEMRLVREHGLMTASAHRPRLNGATVEPADHTTHLLAGFTAAYTAIAERGDELAELVGAFADDEVRVIARPTQAYASLLAETTHPDVLRDALDRDLALAHLARGRAGIATDEALIAAEIEELWAGDVPLVSARPGYRDVRCGGQRLADALTVTPLDRVMAKIRSMGPGDLRTQEWVIRSTLAVRAGQAGPGSRRVLVTPSAGPANEDPARLLAIARGIADSILASAVVEGDRMGWIGLEALDRSNHGTGWDIAPVGVDLYDGACGIALFLAQLAALTDESVYASAAITALWKIPRLLADPRLLHEQPPGAFDGLAGVAYAASHIATVLGDASVGRWVEPLVAATADRIDGEALDIIGGAAGCLAAMLAVHQATGSAAAWEVARRCADRLLDRTGPARPGFAHGDTGVGWALSRFAAAGGGSRYARAGEAALIGVDGPLAGIDEPPYSATWCHGAAGVALACADGAPGATAPALDLVSATTTFDDHSLCHGATGAIEALNVAPQPGHQSMRGLCRARVRQLVAELESTGPRCGTPGLVRTCGLMTGLAGIGYGLLRIGFTASVPSVLLLEAPVNTK